MVWSLVCVVVAVSVKSLLPLCGVWWKQKSFPCYGFTVGLVLPPSCVLPDHTNGKHATRLAPWYETYLGCDQKKLGPQVSGGQA